MTIPAPAPAGRPGQAAVSVTFDLNAHQDPCGPATCPDPVELDHVMTGLSADVQLIVRYRGTAMELSLLVQDDRLRVDFTPSRQPSVAGTPAGHRDHVARSMVTLLESGQGARTLLGAAAAWEEQAHLRQVALTTRSRRALALLSALGRGMDPALRPAIMDMAAAWGGSTSQLLDAVTYAERSH